MDKLGKIFRRTYRSGSLSELGSLAVPWETVVGESVARHSRPRRLKSGILFVNASNPAWAQQLGFYKEDIRVRLNDYLGREAIKEVRFEGRGFDFEEPATQEDADPDSQLDQNVIEEIEARLSSVGDEQLKADLRRLLARHSQARKKG